jgi:CDP-glucose 4,6-dehydratase
MDLRRAFEGLTVLVTGDTGFKGSWLALWLSHLGARVVGYALPAKTPRDNYVVCDVGARIEHVDGDVRDLAAMQAVFAAHQPDVVMHLAAQPLVLASYDDPIETFATNVMGTAHMLECVRRTASVQAVLNVTTDKVYENLESPRGYQESDRLGGHDPYATSKAASELVTTSYRRSFFGADGHGARIATARAGNVVGAGDWADNRIFPDCIRALERGEPVVMRNPSAVRPWQHVLEPLAGYLELTARLLGDDGDRFEGAWNFGPNPETVVPVEALVRATVAAWGTGQAESAAPRPSAGHETHLLTLDISKAVQALCWRPTLDLQALARFSVEGYRVEGPPEAFVSQRLAQIAAYEALANAR